MYKLNGLYLVMYYMIYWRKAANTATPITQIITKAAHPTRIQCNVNSQKAIRYVVLSQYLIAPSW